jgi:hypothetical protein
MTPGNPNMVKIPSSMIGRRGHLAAVPECHAEAVVKPATRRAARAHRSLQREAAYQVSVVLNDS